jgi:hypothetical protein
LSHLLDQLLATQSIAERSKPAEDGTLTLKILNKCSGVVAAGTWGKNKGENVNKKINT